MKFIILALLVSVAAADKVIGGVEADKGEAPYIVNLKYNGAFRCGGSIVAPGWVVTAAHCKTSGFGVLTVTGGDHLINNNEGTEQTITVTNEIDHPSYNTNTLEHDIMMLQLESTFKMNQYVQAASLPGSMVDPAVGLECKVLGWGNTRQIGTNLPNELQVVMVPVVSNLDCNRAYGGGITSGMICLGLLNVGGKDACQGDSGGPVECNGDLHGVTSWGIGCARPEYPGVYTRVSHYIDFINSYV